MIRRQAVYMETGDIVPRLIVLTSWARDALIPWRSGRVLFGH